MGTHRISRRHLLGLAGVGAVGAAAGIGAAGLASRSVAGAAAVEVPKWPWPYRSLDPEDVRKRGHLAYYEGA